MRGPDNQTQRQMVLSTMLSRQKEKIRTGTKLIMEDEKNISSLVTTVEFLFLIFLNVWCFVFRLRNLPWSDAVRVKEPSGYKCI